MTQLVIFDMDGVLINSEPLHFELERELMARLEITVSAEEHQSYVGMAPEGMWTGTVGVVEHLGSDTFVHVSMADGTQLTARAAGELVTDVHIPRAALSGQGDFAKLGARRYLVISIAMVATRFVVTDGVIAEAALAVGACGPVAVRLSEVERAMSGKPLDPQAITDQMVAAALSPIDDVRADAAYRARAAAVLIRRSLAAVQAGGAP